MTALRSFRHHQDGSTLHHPSDSGPAQGTGFTLAVSDGIASFARVVAASGLVSVTIGENGCVNAATELATDGLSAGWNGTAAGWQALLGAGFFVLELGSVTGGRIDASGADAPLALSLALEGSGRCERVVSEVAIEGSVFGDLVRISADARENVRDARVTAELGAGDDRFEATEAGACARLDSTDFVWGGSGDDVLRTGAGDDALFGDWGTLAVGRNGSAMSQARYDALSAGQKVNVALHEVTGDPAPVRLSIGESGAPEDWVEGTGASLYFRLWQDERPDAQDSAFVTDYDGSAAHVATLDPNRSLAPNGSLVSGEYVPLVQSDAVWREWSAGIGLDTPSLGYTNTAGAENKGGNQNPSINSSAWETRPCLIEGVDPPGGKLNYVEGVLDGGRGVKVDGVSYALPRSDLVGVELGQSTDAAKLTFSTFYGNERGAISETALIVLRDSSLADPADPANSKGKVVGYALVTGTTLGEDKGVLAEGGVSVTLQPFRPLGGDAALADPTASASSGAWAKGQPGLVEVSLEALPGVQFDTVEIRSGGYWQASGTGADAVWSPAAQPSASQAFNTDVSDLLLREICFEPVRGPGNDVLDAGSGADLLSGGGDQASVSATIQVTYEGSKAGFANGFGIYDRGTETGVVIDGNVKTGAATYRAAFDLQDIGDVGFFALVNSRNDGLNGARVIDVARGQAILADGTMVSAAFTDDTLNAGAQRMAMNDAGNRIDLNRDGRRVAEAHQIGAVGDEAVSGRIGFEDLTVRSDRDFNDVVFRVALEVSVTGGDMLSLGGNGRRLDGDRDVVEYAKGDGFDQVFQFEADGRRSGDQLHLRGFEAEDVTLSTGVRVNGNLGTLITFAGEPADQGVFLAGVSALGVVDRGDYLLIG